MPDMHAALRQQAHPIGPDGNLDALLKDIGDASLVLLGEATHGTEEFYRMRAAISRRLIEEKDFDAIAVEADWPDALRASRYLAGSAPIHGGHEPVDRTPEDALRGFTRFPLWMWRNTEVVELMRRLREHNRETADPNRRIGFFGLDLYSLRTSMDAVVRYLARVDPAAEKQARARYACFDHLAEDPQQYGYAANFGMRKDCAEEVVQQLVALVANANRYLSEDGADAADELFHAQQNARVAKDAEAYYRTMFLGRDESWNLRDTHMMETLFALREHLQRQGRAGKVVVWAHNSHIGDARATEMGDHGQLNLGQLVRDRYGRDDTYLLGFTTHDGSVTAASEWDSPAERKTVRPSRSDSVEGLFHRIGLERFFLPLRERRFEALADRRLERAIGVIYLPQSERLSHYFHADVAAQFDGVIHVDRSTALTPLDRHPTWQHDEAPETYPTGI
ncbi:MAG: erythromycin esterase family protein [Burkholderiaceae bacterium]